MFIIHSSSTKGKTMKYLADVLTFSRLGLSVWLLIWAIMDLLGNAQVNYAVVFIVAGYAFLSDALDGIFARRYPYTEEEQKKLFYRKDAHAFDNSGDLLLYLALAFSLAAHNTIWLWLLGGAMAVSLVLIVTIETLFKRKSPLAEKIDVIFGWMFGLTLSAMLVVVVVLGFPNNWGWLQIIIGAMLITAVLIPSKWDRLTTRPERRIVTTE